MRRTWSGLLLALATTGIAQKTTHVDVDVVDHAGNPVKGVLLRATWALGGTSNPTPQTVRTDKAGAARVPVRSKMFFGAQLFVEAVMPARPSVRVAVAKPDRRVRFALPPFGTLHVRIRDKQGRAVAGVQDVYLRPFLYEREQFFGDITIGAISAKRHGYFDGTVGTFRHVVLGRRYRIWCKVQGRHSPMQVLAGPTEAKRNCVVSLTDVEAPPGFSLRLKGLDGKRVKNATVGLIFASGARLRAETTLVRDGHLHVTLPREFSRFDEFDVVVVRRGRAGEHLGAVRLPFLQSSRKRALGEVTLQKEPLLVRGQLVHKDGRPIAGAVVSVVQRYHPNPKVTEATAGADRFLEHRTTTDTEGRFEFRELTGEDRPMLINVARGPHQPIDGYAVVDGLSARHGARDHKVVVVRTTFVTGSVAALPPRGTRYVVSLKDARGQQVHDISVRWKPGGVFEIRNWPPGKFTVTVSLSGSEQKRAAVPIEVQEGTPGKPRALQQIKLVE